MAVLILRMSNGDELEKEEAVEMKPISMIASRPNTEDIPTEASSLKETSDAETLVAETSAEETGADEVPVEVAIMRPMMHIQRLLKYC